MGRRSKGCDVCRAKKIKCDEKNPQCSQCKDAGQKCPGSIVGSIFISAALPPRVATRRRLGRAKFDADRSPLDQQVTPALIEDAISVPRMELKRQDEKAWSAVSNPSRSLSGHFVDPFQSLSQIMDRSSSWLTEIYFFYFPRKISTMGPASEWFRLAVADEVILEITLFVTASYFGLKSNSERSLMLAFRHRNNLFQILNRRLEDPVLSVLDSTICAVALLAGSEGINGSASHWQIHMNGLKRMVKMRGGIQNIGARSSATRIIASAYSYGVSRLSSTCDVFFTNDDFQEVMRAFDSHLAEMKPPISFFGPNWYIRHLRLENKGHQNTKLTRILFECLQELQNVSARISSSHYSRWTDADSKYLDGKLTTIEYRLVVLREQSNFSTNGYMEECLCIAGLLFVSEYLRDRGGAAALHQDLLRRLELCVIRSHPELGWNWYWGTIGDEFLLWVLFIGAVSLLDDNSTRFWFEELITSVIERMRLREWDLVECTLKGLFCSAQFLSISRTIWDKVEATLECKSGYRNGEGEGGHVG